MCTVVSVTIGVSWSQLTCLRYFGRGKVEEVTYVAEGRGSREG